MTISTFLYIVSALCLLNAARLKRNEIRRKRAIEQATANAIVEGARRRVESKRQPTRIPAQFKDKKLH